MWKMKPMKMIYNQECHEKNPMGVCLFVCFWNEKKNATLTIKKGWGRKNKENENSGEKMRK